MSAVNKRVRVVTPQIAVDRDRRITIEWPESGKGDAVQMSVQLFEEWVGMLNDHRRLNDLLSTRIRDGAISQEQAEEMSALHRVLGV